MNDVARLRLGLPSPGGDPAEIEVPAPRGPVRLSYLAHLAQDITDFLVGRAIAAERSAGRELSCRAGCGACCRQLVGISPPEAFALADAVAALPEERRDRVMARFDRSVAELDSRGWAGRLGDLRHGHADLDLPALAADYARLGLACPLLVRESCSLHPARPTSCREYNVTSDPAFCADRSLGKVRPVPVGAMLSRPLAEIAADFAGGRATLVPLTHALDYAEEYAEPAFRTWPGVELAEAFLSLLARRS